MAARLAAFVLVALVVSICACSSGDGESTVRGVITNVDAVSLTKINSFTLRTNDGRTLLFVPAPDASRDPTVGLLGGHLRTHAVLGDQIEVYYREGNGELLALRVEDRSIGLATP